MSLQTVNYELVDLLRPFFWHKNDILPGGGCPWKLCAPDGAPDPAFWIDNSGDAFAVGDIWVSHYAELGLSPTDGRFQFGDGWGYTADDMVILWDADFRIWDGELIVDNALTVDGEAEFTELVWIYYHASFWAPVAVYDDWRFVGPAFSNVFTLNDDTATWDYLGADHGNFGFMFLWSLSVSYSDLYAIILYGVGDSAVVTSLHTGADVVVTSGTSFLGGTTGTDGKFTILITTYGSRVYFENRMGAQRKFGISFWSCRDNTIPWDAPGA